MDMLYALLPKDYLEIYHHSTPSRERAASGVASKSWYRWLLTMAWVRGVRQQESERGNGGYLGKGAPNLDSDSIKAMVQYGTTFYFPEQVNS